MLRSTISRPTVITTDVTLQHTSRPPLLLLLHCKTMIVFCKHRIHLESLRREIMACVPSKEHFLLFCFVFIYQCKVYQVVLYPGSSKIPGTRLKSTRVRVLEYSFQP